jgi:hypothetical protein
VVVDVLPSGEPFTDDTTVATRAIGSMSSEQGGGATLVGRDG